MLKTASPMLNFEDVMTAEAANNRPASPGRSAPTASSRSSLDRANLRPFKAPHTWPANQISPSTITAVVIHAGIPFIRFDRRTL